MRTKLYTFAVVLFTTLLSFFNKQSHAQFTPGNLVIYRVGDGVTSLVNTGNPVFLDEYTPSGTLVQTVALPTTISGSNKRLVASGTATSEGSLTRSSDKRYLVLTGYDAALPTTGLTGTTGTAVNRVIGLVDYNEVINTSTGLTDFASGNNARGAFSTNGTDLWGVGGAGGLRYTTAGSSTSTQLSTTVTNLRTVQAFGGQLYVSSSSGAFRVATVGTGIPTSSGQTITNITGGPVSTPSPYNFFFADLDAGVAGADVLYVADDGAGALTKYSLVAGNWVSNGVIGVAADAYRGITGVVNGNSVSLFLTRKGGSGATGGGELVSITDASGYNGTLSGTPTLLATAATNTAFRGIALAPEAPPVIPSVNLSVSSNTGSEAAATVITVTATASSPVTGNQTVDLSVSGTNITAGDYTLSSTVITIPNGTTTGSVTFTVTDDALVESLETATLTISNPSAGLVLGTTLSQNIDITDNDVPPPPVVNLSVSTNSASEATNTVVTVTATASAPVSGSQTVTLGVSGTGITAQDYALSGTVITIANGTTSGTVNFTVKSDAEQEGTETAVLTISSPSAGITLGGTTTQNISITDNTCLPLVRKSTATSANGAEISAFDPGSGRVYTVAGPAMEFYTLNNSGILSGPNNLPFGFTVPGGFTALPNSVAIKNGTVAVGYAIVNSTSNAQDSGYVAFYNAATGAYIHHVKVGYLPDMVTFTPDGNKVLTANEGEPNSYGQGNSFDPEGSVGIIDISGGIPSAVVTHATFISYNTQLASLKAAGVRIFGPGATVAQDLEPEYIAIAADGSTAHVTLQENNAIAVVDIASATVTNILPLGLKDHSLAGNGFDASDRDLAPGFSSGTINIQNWPVKGMYMPDAIARFSAGGNDYFITANEGDSRAYTGYTEEVRVGAAGYVLDPVVFPNAATLKLNQNLGRLQLSNASGDTDNDGDFDEIHALGARSFTIWNSSFARVFDSGDQLEQITATQTPATFNSEGLAASFDTRSDNKGPEPEAVATGLINGVLHAFVGTERTGDVYVYDISNPAAPVFKQYIDNPADVGVEGLMFIPAAQSPTGKALVIATAEVSRTVTVYESGSVTEGLVTAQTTQTQNQGSQNTYGDCSGLVLKIAQAGASPVSGSTEVKVWIEGTQDPSFVKRHYEITPASNATTATARVTLYFTQSEFDDFNAVNAVKLPSNAGDVNGISNLIVEKRSGSSNNGTGLPASYTGNIETINPVDADIIWNAAGARWEISFDVTGFSGFFVKTPSALPVQWLQVRGELNAQKQPVISWKVNENAVSRYTIEKSGNGVDYLSAGLVNSLGDGVNEYQFTDVQNLNGKGYFRIRQTGRDGRNSYSTVIRLSAKNTGTIQLYPNPVQNVLTIRVDEVLQNTLVKLTDAQGKEIKQVQLNGQSTTIDLSNLATGMYLLHFENGEVQKIIRK